MSLVGYKEPKSDNRSSRLASRERVHLSDLSHEAAIFLGLEYLDKDDNTVVTEVKVEPCHFDSTQL